MKYLIGVDEVGRGPLAGPVAVGVVVFEYQSEKKLRIFLDGTRDSKKLSEKKRKEIFNRIKILSKVHNIRYIVCYESNKVIDKKGISFAINSCIEKAFKKLNKDSSFNFKNTKVLLDGGLKAPKEFKNQKTIIRGDDTEFSISLASIIAKVSRDSYMKKISKNFPEYGFDSHKGYGTKTHLKNIKKFGPSKIHRKTFLKRYN